ncbi:MAG: hypothetical protein ACXAB4_11420 [Candidatus Hodarchaeales archaeon]
MAEGDSLEFYINVHDNSGGSSHIITSGATTYTLTISADSGPASSEPPSSTPDDTSSSADSPGFELIVVGSALAFVALVLLPRYRRSE